MAKPKKKLTSKQRTQKRARRKKYRTVFINGKQKRAPREEIIEGVSVEQFIMGNTDPIWLHQHEMWKHLYLREQPLEEPDEQNGLLQTTPIKNVPTCRLHRLQYRLTQRRLGECNPELCCVALNIARRSVFD